MEGPGIDLDRGLCTVLHRAVRLRWTVSSTYLLKVRRYLIRQEWRICVFECAIRYYLGR